MSYLVTENAFYAELFQRLLADDVTSQTEFRSGSNRYDAESLARSLALSKQQPVVLILDARSRYEEDARAEEQQVRRMLRQHSTDRSEAFVVYPSVIEILFSGEHLQGSLSQKGIMKSLLSTVQQPLAQRPSFHDLEWRGIVKELGDQDVSLLRSNELVRDVESFLGAQEAETVLVEGPSSFIDLCYERIQDQLERKGLQFAGIVVDVQRANLQNLPPGRAAIHLKLVEGVAREDVRPILEYALGKIAHAVNAGEDAANDVTFSSMDRKEAAL